MTNNAYTPDNIKMQLPLKHNDDKRHKELNDIYIFLVQLCAFMPWWQKTFSDWTQVFKETNHSCIHSAGIYQLQEDL